MFMGLCSIPLPATELAGWKRFHMEKRNGPLVLFLFISFRGSSEKKTEQEKEVVKRKENEEEVPRHFFFFGE